MLGVDPRTLAAARPVAGQPTAHVVGGAVRDALLGRAVVDVDVVVEGDAIALARELGGDAVVVYTRFGTATLRHDGHALDLVSARRERYTRPGALPDVELGATLEEDLARRDFTVNAIAVAMSDGRRTAVPGALEDLAAGRLRVLHADSFLDDPTRLLRLARYGARLGFAAEPATAALAALAVADGAVETVTATRLGAELRALLGEAPEVVVNGLEALGAPLLAALLGSEAGFDRALLERVQARTPGEARGDLALLAAIVGDAAALEARLRELGFPARDAARAGRAASGGEEGLLEGAVIAAARGSARAARWLDDGRHRRLAIDGDDLTAAGLRGPAVGRGLAAAQRALLDGTASDRDAQLTIALAAAPGYDGHAGA